MKKFLFGFVLTLSVILVSGQITITQNDMPPEGTNLPIGNDTIQTIFNYDFFLTGAPYSWVPPTATEYQSFFYIFQDPADSVNLQALFPQANIMIWVPGYGYYFMDSSATELRMLGIIDSVSLPDPVVLKYTNPDTIMVFPFTYGTAYESNSLMDAKIPYDDIISGFQVDSARMKSETYSEAEVVGHGTLAHPLGIFNVLHEIKNKESIDSTWVRLVSFGWVLASAQTSTNHEINYHSSGFGFPVYQVEVWEDSTVQDIKWIKVIPTFDEVFSTVPLFSVFPNPCTDYVNVATLQGEAERFEIYDISGRMVYSHKSTRAQHQINVSEWSSGIYIIRWLSGNKKIAEAKIVKG